MTVDVTSSRVILNLSLSLQEKCGWPFPVGHRLATTCSASTQTCTSRWTKRKPSGCAPSATSPRSTTTSCSTASSTTFSCRRGKFVHPGTVLMALVVDYPTVLKVLSSNPMESLLSSFSFFWKSTQKNDADLRLLCKSAWLRKKVSLICNLHV